MKIKFFYVWFLSVFCFASVPATQPKIQIALLLDASGSMDGLINQAQSKLWQLVSELATAKKQGKTATLEVALYMYGHDSLARSEDYVKCLEPLTTDLDRISEVLFQIQTNGGEEYCGSVIQQAIALPWSSNPKDYKAIFIAGNEPFNQGPVDFKKACSAAISQGIIVNTIFCGDAQEGIRTSWKAAAQMADGTYMTLDHQRQVAQISTPQDSEILTLGTMLNETYVGYGATGSKAKRRQERQDANAVEMSEEAAVARTVAKASPAYQTESWDLVTAVSAGSVELEGLEKESLPPELQDKSPQEQKAYLSALEKKREEIKSQIAQLKAKREQFLATSATKDESLSSVMLNAIRGQITRLNFELPQ